MSVNGPARLFHVAAAALVAMATVWAPAAMAAPDLAQILARNAAARGGEEAWRHIEAISFAGKVDIGHDRPAPPNPATAKPMKKGEWPKSAAPKAARPDDGPMIAVPYRLELKRPRMSRFELDFNGTTATQVYDGKNGWKVRPYLHRTDVEPYSADELKQAAEQQELDGLLLNATAKGSKIAFDGQETVDGVPTYRLKVHLADGNVRTVWLDAKTFLELRIDGERMFDGKPHTVYTYYRDYRTVDRVSVPYTFETVVDGTPMREKLTVEKVVVNPALPAGHFAKPDASGGRG